MKLNTYLAFTNCAHTKESAIALAQHHFDAYTNGDDFEACSVDCMAGGNHQDYAKLFNIDPRIAYASDAIFDGLPHNEKNGFTLQLFKAIPEGADTNKIYARFMAKVLRRAAKHDATGNCEAVAKLHDLLVDGVFVEKDWARDTWAAGHALAAARYAEAAAAASSATGAAAASSASAAWAAEDAARAAARAARGAAGDAAWTVEYQQQAQDLIDSCECFGVAK